MKKALHERGWLAQVWWVGWRVLLFYVLIQGMSLLVIVLALAVVGVLTNAGF